MKRLIILCSILTLSSCATIFNGKNKGITIYTEKPAKLVYGEDTIQSENNRFEILAKRKAEDLKFEIISDSVKNEFSVPSRLSPTVFNNIYNGFLGLFLDLKNNKQYTYPAAIFINPNKHEATYKKFGIGNHKNEAFLDFYSPLIVNMAKEIENGAGSPFRFDYGLSVGYYHAPNQYLSLSFDSFNKMGQILDPFTKDKALIIRFTNNHRFNRFDIGYGPNVTFRERGITHKKDVELPSVNFTSLGVTIPVKFRITEIIYLGVDYSPTFYNTGYLDKFEYNHTLNIKLGCQVNLHTFRFMSFFGNN
ncbi:hypothetical protein EDL99_06360 [Ornithobacterium rhinotracheale]|uniref:hypothetical protein n=1 Tax=Ornithobacterium rhinotracheale TaxID=28251 RepID=UPI00129CC6FE|nr:hypothetical protein [Ornithobacterium rhinotracheale]MRJ08494.1 hypothetical protein [Ornithobacterium rhinotracheale]UOH76770.1 hypothetical protein MT996_05940 [Ornithobacterium rhinotracheale]